MATLTAVSSRFDATELDGTRVVLGQQEHILLVVWPVVVMVLEPLHQTSALVNGEWLSN